MARDRRAKRRRGGKPGWMRKEVLGSLFVLVILVASSFAFIFTGGQGNGVTDVGRPLQLARNVTGLEGALAMAPSGAVNALFTDTGNGTGAELLAWAKLVTGVPSEGLFGRPVSWFAQVNYPSTQGASQLEVLEHWVQMLSFGNSTIYGYPNVQPQYRGINVTRHPNFYYTPNTEPVVVSLQREDLYSVLDRWLGSGGANSTAAEEYAGLLAGVPQDADWAFVTQYANRTSPLGFSDRVCAAISTLGSGEYNLNVSARLREGAQPNATLFVPFLNSTLESSFNVADGYARYGLRAGMDEIDLELFRLGLFYFRG